jgi:hypothetical protein
VYIDKDVAVEQRHALDAFSAGDGFIQLSFTVPAGFHQLLVVARYGASNAPLDVLPGHSRHLVLQMCNSLLHTDTLRSVAVVLPARGLTPYLIVHAPQGDEKVAMSIEDGVAYGELLDEGSIELIVPYGNRVVSCSFSLSQATPNWSRQHLRFNLPITALVNHSDKPAPATCGTIQPL